LVPLTRDDIAAAAALPGVRVASGVVLGRAELAAEGGARRTTPLVGVDAAFADLSANQPDAGRFFTAEEVEARSRVALLGSTPAKDLYGEANPVGSTIAIDGLVFRIIGRMPSRGLNPWKDPDDLVVIPITLARRAGAGRDVVDQLQLEVTDSAGMADAERSVRDLLARRHPGPAHDADAFLFRNMARVRKAFEDITAILSWLLLSVSAISLLVGGIGIMNIMLVTVTERTREVGLRKALGARVRDVRQQFLAEAVLLSLCGGTAGVAAGFAVLHFTAGLGVPAAWAWRAAAAAFGAAWLTGVVFGFWPASRAAARETVESLRYE
jgi:macrolide transport system ATP-binding/permease protein